MRKIKPCLLLIAFSFLILFSFFGKILVQPNAYLFASDGDGLKNYFTPAYYVKYDNGVHFTGMNYPYGENVLFTDNQPVISWTLNFIDDHIGPIDQYVIGIMNSLMLYSVVICIILLFVLLTRFNMPPWYAIIMAILLGFMSPQLLRMSGHFALAYSFFFPALWLLALKLFDQRQPWAWTLALIFFQVFFGFVHLYYLMIGCFFLLSFIVIFSIINITILQRYGKMLLGAIIAATLPVLIIKGWLTIYDTVPDRPGKPYGLDLFLASFNSVFIPMLKPQKTWFDVFHLNKGNWEGYAYVGLVGMIILLSLFLRTIIYLLRAKWKKAFSLQIPQQLLISILAATLILFFSMGYPTLWFKDAELNFFDQLRQFRSAGRFAWVFYYVFTVFSAVLIYRFYSFLIQHGKKVIAAGLMIFVIAAYSFDAYTHVRFAADNLQISTSQPLAAGFLDDKNNYSKWIRESGYSISDFQAILPIPFFLKGSELFDISGASNSLKESFKASLDTGIPIATMNMSRTSLTSTLKTTQLLSSDYIRKEIIDDLPNKKSLLLLVTSDQKIPNEAHLISKGKFIFSNENVSLYDLPLSSFKTSFSEINTLLDNHKTQMFNGDWYLSYLSKPFFLHWDKFNNQTYKGGFNDSGALFLKQGMLICFERELPPEVVGKDVEISFWVKANKDAEGLPVAYLEQINPNGEVVEKQECVLKKSNEVYKNWIRAEFKTHIDESGRKLKVYAVWHDIVIDNLLIRPENSDIFYEFSEDSSRYIMNNYFIDS